MKLGYLLVAIIVIGAFAASVPILNTTKEDFSSYNQDWNGCSQLKEVAAREGYPTRTLFSLDGISGTSAGTLIMLNPSTATSLTDQEISAIKSFVESGGSLVLANDFGNGNAIVQGLGLGHSFRFSGLLLDDNTTNWADGAHPLVTNVSSSSATAGVHVLYCNYATTLNVTDGGVAVLASSAPTSVAHAAGTNASQGGVAGPQPVIASLGYGKGRIVLISDPSLFINGMLAKGDNEQLFTALMANLTGGTTAAPLLFDESHRATNPIWTTLYAKASTDDTLKYVVIISSMAAVVAGINVVTLKRKPHPPHTPSYVPVNPDAAVEDIIEAHPTWHRSQVKRILKQLQSRRRTLHGDKK